MQRYTSVVGAETIWFPETQERTYDSWISAPVSPELRNVERERLVEWLGGDAVYEIVSA